MIHDEYFVSIETGEICLSSEAIADFYKTHNGLEDWRDVWKFYETAEVELSQPDFKSAIGA